MSQVGGSYYEQMDIQPLAAMRAWMSGEAFVGFLLGNVIKYVARYRAKNGIEDLHKAADYLRLLIEEEEIAAVESEELADMMEDLHGSPESLNCDNPACCVCGVSHG